MAAASTQWNSGRFVSRRAIVSPRLSPRPASPPASARTLSPYSAQVMLNSSPFVRSATRSACSSAVTWKAAHSVGSLSALNSTFSASRGWVVASIAPPLSVLGRILPGTRSAHAEALPRQPPDVVRQADEEEAEHEREAEEARALHHAERHRAAPDLLDERPEDVAAVERQERVEVDDRERERDQRDDPDGVPGVVLDRLARDLEAVDRGAQCVAGGLGAARAGLAVGEPDPHPLRLRVVDRCDAEREPAVAAPEEGGGGG